MSGDEVNVVKPKSDQNDVSKEQDAEDPPPASSKDDNKPPGRFTWRWFGFNFDQAEDSNQAPKMSPWELFLIFLSFGCRAFGGPVAQITMMRDELVTEKKWITMERFNRVFAVYQILPGPEAFELAVYFGTLSLGRIGGLLGGLGFALPGVILMLVWSFIYVHYGESRKVKSSFQCVQITVSTFIFKANYKLAEHCLYDSKTKTFHWHRGFLCLFCFLVR